MASVQTIRLPRPDPKVPNKVVETPGLLQDRYQRSARKPWNPSSSLALRILLLVRVAGAMYANISDCDEVFNFWEPLHYLERGHGFQTWETSPAYAIRSWAYISLHLIPARLARFLLGSDKRPTFFAVRMTLALVSVLTEVKLHRAISDHISRRVGRYFFFMMLFNAGMWNAATAFLPSSFAMYCTALAFAFALAPSDNKDNKRTLRATLSFAAGGVIGWPFALALAIPFIFEELFVAGADRVSAGSRSTWIVARWKRLVSAGLLSLLIFVPVVAIDSSAYGKLSLVPWNIIKYNIFGGSERGPELYGTSPWNFYLLNLVLNFNVLASLALLSLPALAVTYRVDRQRLVPTIADQSSCYTILALRLAPFYLWIGILSAQAHKEERFMFPVYPLLCFNAAVTLYLVRGWLEVAFVTITKSPYQASRSSLFRNFTSSIIVGTNLLSIARIFALWYYYHAPMSIFYQFEATELPRLLNATGLLPQPPQHVHQDDLPRIDLSPVVQFDLRLCLGKEWYRFPSHFLVPEGIRVDFIKSEFDGMLPGHFKGHDPSDITGWWLRPGTRHVSSMLNDLNREEMSFYVPVETCDYLVDLDFPEHPLSTILEPRYAVDNETWERVVCRPFLDTQHSNLLTRVIWMPGETWQKENSFGDFCLLKNRVRVASKEAAIRGEV